MDVGQELRQARERRGLTLHHISYSTKISLRVLQAIEASDESRLPATVFTRSFVRSYAKEVGLDPDDTMRRYLEQFVPPETSGAIESAPDARPAVPAWATSLWEASGIVRERLGTPIVFAVVVMTLIGLSIRNYPRAHPEPTRPATPAVGTAGVARADTPLPTPAGTAGTSATPADQLHLTIAPTGPCWAGATVDGQQVLAALLDAADHRKVDAPKEVILRVGDPATCALTINGKPAHIPGAAGKAVTAHITTENYAQFLAR